MKNKLLLVGIGISVVGLSLIASYSPINWVYFSIGAIFMSVLILSQKNETKKLLEENVENQVTLFNFKDKLNTSFQELLEISKIGLNDDFNNRLTEIIETTFPNIDEYRISIINQFGIANYTKIAIPFAKAERIINRGFSASVDGYLEESIMNIEQSINLLKNALDEITTVEQNG